MRMLTNYGPGYVAAFRGGLSGACQAQRPAAGAVPAGGCGGSGLAQSGRRDTPDRGGTAASRRDGLARARSRCCSRLGRALRRPTRPGSRRAPRTRDVDLFRACCSSAVRCGAPSAAPFSSMSITASARSGELVLIPRARSANLISASIAAARLAPSRWRRAPALDRAPAPLGPPPAARARRRASARARSRAVSIPTSRAYAAAAPNPSASACEISQDSNRRASGVSSKASGSVQVAPCMSTSRG